MEMFSSKRNLPTNVASHRYYHSIKLFVFLNFAKTDKVYMLAEIDILFIKKCVLTHLKVVTSKYISVSIHFLLITNYQYQFKIKI